MVETLSLKRIPGSSNSSWHISEELTGMAAGGTGYSSLPGILTGQDDVVGSMDVKTRSDKFVCFSARGTTLDIAYPMHTFCHDLLQQVVASISSSRLDIDDLGKFLSSLSTAGEGRGLKPEWSPIGYGGAEQFWRGSWDWMEGPEFSDDEYSNRPAQWDFLVSDPKDLEHYQETLQTPPVTPILEGRPPAVFVGKEGSDILTKPPYEIIESILSLLSIESVNALRLVSCPVAAHGLSSTFWQSRFCYPHELSHIPISLIAAPYSPELRIDWKLLYYALLWPEYEESLLDLEGPERSWKNKSRIARIIRHFAVALLGLEGIESIAGWGQHSVRETDLSIRRKVLSCNPRLVTLRDSFYSQSFHPASL